jgi:hypothetical protein
MVREVAGNLISLSKSGFHEIVSRDGETPDPKNPELHVTHNQITILAPAIMKTGKGTHNSPYTKKQPIPQCLHQLW